MKQFFYYYYLFLLIFTPLIFVSNTGELFEFPKTFFIYFSALLCAMVFCIDIVIRYKKPIPLSLPVLLYLSFFILSTITSMHLYTSVWGYYTRFNEGLMSVLAFIVLYFIARNKFDSADFDRLSSALLLPIIPVAIYGIFQYFGILEGKILFGERTDRVYSTFGQPNWLAQYLVMLLPLVLFKIFKDSRSWFWYLTFFLGYTCLWFTFSMSGFAGFILSFFPGVIFLVKKLGFKELRIRIGLLLMYMIILLALFPGILESRIHDIKQDILGQLVTSVRAQSGEMPQDPTKYKLSDAGYIRKSAWIGTWNLITSSSKNLLLGTGPETYPYSFQPFRPLELNYSSEWSFLFNKPHNYYLEIWAEQGLIGLIVYSVLFIKLFVKSSPEKKLGLVGFAITNMFGWPVIATTLIFWFWFAESEAEREIISI